MKKIKLNPAVIGKEFPADYSGTKFKLVDEDDKYVYIVFIKDGVDGPKCQCQKTAYINMQNSSEQQNEKENYN